MARRQKLIPDEEPKPPPVEEDLRHDDLEFDPTIEPRSAKAWLNLLQESEDAFEDWHSRCDNIDKQYANLMRLADMHRDKEFQMFWSNAEVIKPSIYAKPPQPVVTPKFKDRRPVYQAASELAERCAVVSFDLAEIDELMKLVRDDLALIDRGVAWCRYESGKGRSYYGHEKVCIDFKGRKDFLHSVSRNWREVTWVAAASYLTRAEARKRFYPTSGTEYQQAEYRVDREAKEIGGADRRERAKFWEIWDKGSRRVVWVAQGCELILSSQWPDKVGKGLMFISLDVSVLDALRAELEGRGVDVKNGQWGYRLMVTTDPYGNELYFPYPMPPAPTRMVFVPAAI